MCVFPRQHVKKLPLLADASTKPFTPTPPCSERTGDFFHVDINICTIFSKQETPEMDDHGEQTQIRLKK